MAGVLGVLEDGQALCPLGNETWGASPHPLIIDPGAAEAVTPASWMEEHEVKPSKVSGGEVLYGSSQSAPLQRGKRKLRNRNEEGGQERTVTLKVANVDKALGSASKVVRNGNVAAMGMDEQGRAIAYAEDNATKERLDEAQGRCVCVY